MAEPIETKRFLKLKRRDFDNEGFISEIHQALKDRDLYREQNPKLCQEIERLQKQLKVREAENERLRPVIDKAGADLAGIIESCANDKRNSFQICLDIADVMKVLAKVLAEEKS